jgi:subtilase family serine protease
LPFGCNHALSPDSASCFGFLSNPRANPNGNSSANSRADPHDNSGGPAGLGPADIQKAYHVPSTVKPGTTVAIVDAYDDPSAESDLAVYRGQFNLPPCTTANGCFKKLNQAGVRGSYPGSNEGWAQEISLDLDAVSATCPGCHITLIEANTQHQSDFDIAMDSAWATAPQAISNSYGFAETQSQLTNDDPHYNHPNVTVSTGDSGYGVSFPSTSPHVIAVGGTSLVADSSARGFTESAWSGTGSGCSAVEPKPAWQKDTGCPRRTVADVSADANPATGLAVYDSYVTASLFPLSLNPPATGWVEAGGTSLASPIIASIIAMSGNVTAPSYLYSHTSALTDITTGSNCTNGLLDLFGPGCPGNYLDTAKPGYDGPTGLGTPWGTTAL